MLAQALYMAGQYAEAVRQANHTLELTPNFHFALLFAGLAEFCGGNQDRGIRYLEEAVQSGRMDFYAALGLCYGQARRRDEALRILETLENQEEPAPPFALGAAYLGCAEPLKAAASFQRCVEHKHWHLLLLHSDPLFAKFGKQKRFRGFVQCMDLPTG